MKNFVTLLFLLLNTFLYGDIIDAHYDKQREKLIEIIKQEVKNTSEYLGKDKLDKRVIDAINSVPRHKFVPFYSRLYAYKNRPLAIGHGQTISQPYIVAIMTDLLNLKPSDRVLEIGTGSGYQAAIAAQIVKEVYSIEVIEPLGLEAKKRLTQLGYNNIKTRIADGYYGWKEHAPYDAIIVTAAAGHIPPPLLKQLKPGGTMIIPVGDFMFVQKLILIQKDQKGDLTTRQIMSVRFVPLTGKH
ncbi:MAG: protein-L-isoaspartate(D-aspartate) O-methyltransferase [Deltaproteobacteria bacterium]|nr:protein-L-isoaspartate(D-aspartate) O-methyltransferase [Deltaproteobacteria bacterium]